MKAPAFWQDRSWRARTLIPLGLLYCSVAMLRRQAYRRGLFKVYRAGVPVVVVGNITVGGSGKTPLITRLVELAREGGWRPGIVSRGYRGQAQDWPRRVDPDSDPFQVGDEPVLLARRCRCPVAVDPDRPRAVALLLEEGDCDLILADDGLQHYRLGRDLEVAVVDGSRRLGNGLCLPAGPLREPPDRLKTVDLVVVNGRAREGENAMELVGEEAVNLIDPDERRPLGDFRGRVHAVAGIGNPQRFFAYLEQQGLRIIPHPFADHHPFTPEDLHFGDGRPVLMTEKDAVKCLRGVRPQFWYLPVTARLDPEFESRLLARLDTLTYHS